MVIAHCAAEARIGGRTTEQLSAPTSIQVEGRLRASPRGSHSAKRVISTPLGAYLYPHVRFFGRCLFRHPDRSPGRPRGQRRPSFLAAAPPDKAVALTEAFSKRNPESGGGHRGLALALLGQGRYEDALQELSEDGQTVLIFAFKNDFSDGRLIVRPRGLIAETTYSVTSVDVGPLGDAQGDLLMTDGIEVIQSSGSRAHVLILRAQ